MRARKAMRNKFLFLIFLFCFVLGLLGYTHEAQAQDDSPPRPAQVSVGLLISPELRFQRGVSQEIESQTIYNWGLVVRYAEIFSAIVEFADLSENSGNGSSQLEMKQKEILAWGRWHFLGVKVDNAKLSLFGGVGAGTFEREVKTTLLGDSRTDKSGLQRMAGLTLGGDLVFGEQYKILVGLEGRSLFSSDFDPNPTFSLMVRTGMLYRF